jgi:hypothetical protein
LREVEEGDQVLEGLQTFGRFGKSKEVTFSGSVKMIKNHHVGF